MAKAKDYFLVSDLGSGGVNTIDDPRELAENESPEIINMDIAKRGRVISRTGYEKWGTASGVTTGFRGMLRYYRTFGSDSGDFLLSFNSNGNSYKSTNTTPAPASIGSYGTDSGSVRGIVFDNQAIFGNGLAANTLQSWEGTGSSGNVGGTPPDANVFGIINNSLVVSTPAAPQTIQWCDIGDPDAWAAGIASNTAVPTKDGGDVRAILDSNDQPIVLAEASKHLADMTFDASDLLVRFAFKEKVDNSGGCGATGSAMVIPNEFGEAVMYLSATQGYQTYGALATFPDKRSPAEIGFKIQPTTNQINFNAHDVINSEFHGKKYICLVPFQESTKNTHAFVFNTRFGAWTVYKGMNFADITRFRDSFGRDMLLAASNSTGEIYKFTNTFSDDGFGYDRIYRSRTWDFGNRVRMEYIDFTGSKVQGLDVKIDITVDNQTETFVVTDKNLVEAVGGGYVADNWVGDNYSGGAVGLQGTPMFKFQGRAQIAIKKEGQEISWRSHNNKNGAGYSMQSYGLKIAALNTDVARNVSSGGSGYLQKVGGET